MFGPSQSGKTTGLIRGIEEWIGPAVVSSVKTDLLHRTSTVVQPLARSRSSTRSESAAAEPRPGARFVSAATLDGALAAAQLLAPADSDDELDRPILARPSRTADRRHVVGRCEHPRPHDGATWCSGSLASTNPTTQGRARSRRSCDC